MSTKAATGPVVFITGCSNGGIGSAIAKEFARKGCLVYASARKVAAMSDLTHENIRKLQVDVLDEASLKTAVDEIYANTEGIDILYSNAGVPGHGPVLDVTTEQTWRIFDTNLMGFVRLVHLVLPRMAARRRGTIVATGSILGELGTPFSGVYNASKAAIHAYTETLALECQPLGVNVMLLSPGSVISNIGNGAHEWQLPEGSLYTEYLPQIRHVIYMAQTAEYGAMPTDKFASEVVAQVLKPTPPRYFCTGGTKGLWTWLKLLPRTYALQQIWNRLSKPPPKH